VHGRTYAPLDDTGATLVSGRYHRAAAEFPWPRRNWRVLYLSLAPEIAMTEWIRHQFGHPRRPTSGSPPWPRPPRLSELAIELAAVLDCRDPTLVGLTVADLCRSFDLRATDERRAVERAYGIPRRLAWAARARGAEGLLVPSATRLGANLIVVTDRLRPDAQLEVVGQRDPDIDRYR
jgi:hypothetical protein